LTFARVIVGLTVFFGQLSLVAVAPSHAATQDPPAITHDPIQCWPRDQFLVLQAQFQPPFDIRTAKIYIRSEKHADFSWVELTVNTRGEGSAILPQPTAETTRVIYFLEMITRDFRSSRTQQWNSPVLDSGACRQRDPAAIWFSGEQPNIHIGATHAGAPKIPLGFQANGISRFTSAAGMTQNVGGGFGLGKTALIAGGGGAVAALLVTNKDEDSPATGSPPPGATTSGNTSSTGTTTVVGQPTTTISGGGSGPTTSVLGPTTTTTGTGGPTTSALTSSTSTVNGPTTSVTTSVTTTSVSTTSVASTSTVTTTVEPQADISVSKGDRPDPVSVNSALTYTITARNLGPANATNVLLRDSLPSTVRVTSLSGPCSYNPSSHEVICILGPLARGAQRQVEINVRAQAAGVITNSASVRGAPDDPNPSNDSTSVTTRVTSTQRTTDMATFDLTYTSFLDVAPYDGSVRGQILLNGEVQVADNVASRFLSSRARLGVNRLEARLETEIEADGFWRFNFSDSPSFVVGSLRVESGAVASQNGRSVVFVLKGGTQPIRFTFELR
jgi:uncharacterized repeat protein (TIGR01451 family)